MTTVVIVEGERPSLMPEGPVLETEVLGQGTTVLRYGLLETVPAEVLARADAVIVRPGVRYFEDGKVTERFDRLAEALIEKREKLYRELAK